MYFQHSVVYPFPSQATIYFFSTLHPYETTPVSFCPYKTGIILPVSSNAVPKAEHDSSPLGFPAETPRFVTALVPKALSVVPN